jgi:hypothetical protein
MMEKVVIQGLANPESWTCDGNLSCPTAGSRPPRVTPGVPSAPSTPARTGSHVLCARAITPYMWYRGWVGRWWVGGGGVGV